MPISIGEGDYFLPPFQRLSSQKSSICPQKRTKDVRLIGEVAAVECRQEDETMPFYLNQDNALFIKNLKNDIYVDKSMLIKETNELIRTPDKFMCVTRPRRFGKSMALSMLNAYYSKGCDSRELFKNLKICDDPSFEEHLNKHNVISIDMASVYNMLDEGEDFVKKLKKYIYLDLKEAFSDAHLEHDADESSSLALALKDLGNKGERFVFLIDEWDVLFRKEPTNKALCDSYMRFLSSLFKSGDVSRCIDLVYMTGIFPIERFALRCELNNFIDCSAARPSVTRESIGYTEEEVKDLCVKWDRDFSEIKCWFGSYLMDGVTIYNPISVNNAIEDRCEGRWIFTASRDPLAQCMNFNNGELKGDFEALMDGGRLRVDVGSFWGGLDEIDDRDEALTTLIYLGYLGYDEKSKECFIPNKEIAKDVVRAARSLKWDEMSGAMLSPDWKGRP